MELYRLHKIELNAQVDELEAHASVQRRQIDLTTTGAVVLTQRLMPEDAVGKNQLHVVDRKEHVRVALLAQYLAQAVFKKSNECFL